MKTLLKEILKETKEDIKVEFIDIDVDAQTAMKYAIKGVPTLIKVNELNLEVERIVGNQTKQKLVRWLES
tara:strand:- start:4600 stop:4809 length:210 start_codon:yes stop_codon:yes gene_type:complete